MKFLLLLLFVIQKSSTSCDSQCDCPDFEELYQEIGSEYTYEEKAGCTRSLVCTAKMISAEWDDTNTNIPTRVGVDANTALHDIDTPRDQLPVITADIFSTFGIVCENGSWMITKFPKGINALEYIPIKEANGKGYKAQVKYLASINY